jgi:hypothetical protein
MTPLEAALLVAFCVLPFHWLIQRELARNEDPDYLRRHGVVIVRESALQAHAEKIGEYRGQPIWASVTFKGMVYRFERVAALRNESRLRPGELWIAPGLVYTTE